MVTMIKGKLLGNDGNPAARVALDLHSASRGRIGPVLDSAFTSPHGIFEFGLPPELETVGIHLHPGLLNDLWLSARRGEIVRWQCDQRLVDLSPGPGRHDLGATRASYSFVSGRVADADTGRPVAGVMAQIRSPGNPAVVRSVRTGADGRFSMDGLRCYPFDDEEFGLTLLGGSVGYESGTFWPAAPTPYDVVGTNQSSIGRGPIPLDPIPLQRFGCPDRAPVRPGPPRRARLRMSRALRKRVR